MDTESYPKINGRLIRYKFCFEIFFIIMYVRGSLNTQTAEL